MVSKIGLGTAQFGIKYGMINPKDIVPEREVFKILKGALDYGINIFDTAVSYGVSEEVIGKFIKKNNVSLNIISKLPLCNVGEIKDIIKGSLHRISVNRLYGYLFHNFQHYRDNSESWDILEDMKRERRIDKIGFSLYYTQDLEHLLKNNIKFDILQLPYSILDRRFEKYFNILKNKNIELHVRSIFLQGLFFMDPNKLHPFFSSIVDKLTTLRKIALDKSLTTLDICLKFVLSNKYIDKVIVGVHTLSQLKEIISTTKNVNRINDFSDEFSLLRVENEKILLPFNWNLN